MKKIIIVFYFFISGLLTTAQTKSIPFNTDSIPVIQLNDVSIKGFIKNQDQRLKDFWIANKAASTEDILSRLPDINLIRRGNFGAEPLIRTYNSGEINILLDGMRIHGACTDKMDPVTIYIEPQNLQSLNIQAIHSCQEGSNIGGTINLKLAGPVSSGISPFSGYISSGYQTAAKAFYETGYLNYRQNKWTYRSDFSFRKGSDYRTGGGGIIPYSQYGKLNGSFSAKYQINNQWSFKSFLLMDDGWNIGFPALPMDVGYAAARIISLSLFQEKNSKYWSNTEFKVYGNSIYHLMDDSHRKDSAIPMNMPGHSKTFFMFANTFLHISDKQHLKLRADIASTDLDASMTMLPNSQSPMFMLTLPDNNSIQAGLAATYSAEIRKGFSFVTSARVDQFINTLTTTAAKRQLSGLQEPLNAIYRILKNVSAEVAHYFNPGIKTFLTISYAERMPTSNECYGFYLFNAFDNYDYIGSTSLKQESAFKTDFSFTYIKPALRLSLSAFTTKVNNYILGFYQPGLNTMTIGADGVKIYKNIPYAFMSGIESGIILTPFKSIQFISTCKYNYGSDNNNNPLPLIAPFTNISSLKKQIGNWSLLLETNTATAQNRVNILAKEKKSPGYCIFNTRFSYTFSSGKFRYILDFGVENLFDIGYREHLDWGNINRPGRNIYSQISCSF